MSSRIVCTVDHSPEGATSGALVAIHLESDGPIEGMVADLRDTYPNCELAVTP